MQKFGWRGSPRRIIAVSVFLLICVLVRNLKTSHIRELKQFVEAEKYSDASARRGSEFIVQQATGPKDSDAGYKRYGEIEPLYRQVESDIYYTRQYSLALLRQMGARIPNNPSDLAGVMEDVKHRFSVAQHDLWKFRNESGLIKWQREEVEALSDLIQRRIHALQNPEDCASAKKLLCNLPVVPKARGTGSQLHHLTYCFLAAYGTQRTLVINKKETSAMHLDLEAYFLPLSENCAKTTTQEVANWPGTEDALVVQFPDTDRPVPRPNYLPRSVPRDFAGHLASFHGDPFAWWMGQLMKYVMRMNTGFQESVEKLGARLGFEGPVVGVQVRRTDKLLHDSRLIGLEEYMEAVDDFYDDLEVRGTTVTTRKVYLATDDPKVLKEAKERFPKHTFVYNEESVASANMKERRGEANIHNFLADIYFLSRSDFLVCGMSSNICRLAYELMQTLHADATWKVFSVDSPYWFHFQSGHEVEARFPHTPRRDSEIELKKGDRVKEVLRHYSNHRNLHDGFIHGVNQRTRKAGLYPIYKTVDVLRLADTPPFDAIDRRDKASAGAQQEQLKEAETNPDAAGEGEGGPPIPDPSTTRPFMIHEGTHKLYRRVESDIFYARQYVVAKLRHFDIQIRSKTERERLAGAVDDLKHNFRVTQYDLWRLGSVSGLHAWQEGEAQALTDLIQHRIHVLQNPADCKSAKKISCKLPVHLKVSYAPLCSSSKQTPGNSHCICESVGSATCTQHGIRLNMNREYHVHDYGHRNGSGKGCLRSGSSIRC